MFDVLCSPSLVAMPGACVLDPPAREYALAMFCVPCVSNLDCTLAKLTHALRADGGRGHVLSRSKVDDGAREASSGDDVGAGEELRHGDCLLMSR